MTDRLLGVTVTFERDFREDDAKPLLDAIRLLRGVASVDPVVSDGLETQMVTRRVQRELAAKLEAVLYPSDKRG